MKKFFFISLLYIFLFSSSTSAASFSAYDFFGKYPALTNTVVGITSVFLTGMVYDIILYPENQLSYLPAKPRKALLRSAIFPGWGQYYNGQKTKAILYSAIFTGGIVTFLTTDYMTNTNLNKYTDTGEPNYYDRYVTSFTIRKYTFIGLGLFYLYNILDAYISAFFSDIKQNSINLSFEIRPNRIALEGTKKF